MAKTYRPKRAPAAAAQALASTEQLKQDVAEVVNSPVILGLEEAEEAQVSGHDPKDHEEYMFTLRHKTKRGKVYEGTFTNRILTTGENQQAAALKARFAAGMAFDSMEPTIRALNEAIAHMSYSLWSKDGKTFRGPQWAQDLRDVLDQDAVFAVWQEVWAHESHFFRLDATEGNGAQESQE